ncbi:unnamed protein product [Symbiodinium sp. CCMP2592]|nr:unnamed protein product [Symbiodinium sp. CCMP2592]
MALGRPLQVSLVGGSLASLAFRAAEELLGPQSELPSFVAGCPLCPLEPEQLHVPSFFWGILAVFFKDCPPTFLNPFMSLAGLEQQVWRARASSISDEERGVIAREVGRFFARALAGTHRGQSGTVCEDRGQLRVMSDAEEGDGSESEESESAKRTVAAIFISEHEGKIVTVMAASAADRSKPAEFSLKIWVSDSQFGFATAPSGRDVHEARFAAIEVRQPSAKQPAKKPKNSELGAVPGTPLPPGRAEDEPVPGVGALSAAASSLGEADAEVEAQLGASPIETAVLSLTKIVGSWLCMPRLSTVLWIEPRGCFPQVILRETLSSDPSQIFTSIENQLEEDLLSRRVGSALQDSRATSRAWLEYRSHIGNFPTTVRMAWSVCGIWDALRAGRHDEARARCALCIAACDQQAFDNGQWTLAEQFLLEQPPPLSAFAGKRNASSDATDTYHTRLVEPRWAELCLHKVRELEQHLEAKKKLGGKGRGRGDGDADGRQDKGDKADKGAPKGGRKVTGQAPPGVLDLLTPRVSSSPGPFGSAFFRGTLSECSPFGNRAALELIALVFDSLAAEPLHRVARGPGASFKSRRWQEPFSSSVHRAWDRLANAVSLWDSALPVDAAAMGRTAGKVERVEEQVRALAVLSPDAAPGHFTDFNLAKDIEVGRLSLPSEPPAFDPSPFLDGPMRSLYLTPSAHAWPVEEADRFDHRTACGVFALPKSIDADRLIVDARPSNLCMPTDVRWLSTMGSASALLGLELAPHQQLYLSGDDIKDFYHQFRVTTDRTAQYRIVGSFKPRDLSPLSCFEPGLWKSRRVVAALCCMAMGDCNAVSVAQSAHVIGLILQAQVVGWDELLVHKGPVPRSPAMLGLVIDDVIVIERALRRPHFEVSSSRSQRIVDGLHRAYAAAPLPRHEKKAFFASDSATFWGADVPSWVSSVLCVPPGAGCSWVAALSFRRRCLCLLDQVYVLQKGRERHELVRVPPSLRAELFKLCVLAPLLATDLRAQSCGLVVASDASSSLGAVVTARVSPDLVRELLRHTPTKGLWNKLLSPVNALLREHQQLEVECELPGGIFRTHPLWTLVARTLHFRLHSVFRRRRRDHINIKEMDAYLSTEESLSPFGWESARTLSLLDSQVVLGALLKADRALDSFLLSAERHPLQMLGFDLLHKSFAQCPGTPGFYGAAEPPPSACVPASDQSPEAVPLASRQAASPVGAVVGCGFPWAITFDWLHGESQDLLRPALQSQILAAVESRVFSAVGLSPSCPTFSAASYRSSEFPLDLPGLSASASARAPGQQARRFRRCVVRLKPCLKTGRRLATGSTTAAPTVDLGKEDPDPHKHRPGWKQQAKHKVLRGRASGTAENWTKLAEHPPQQATLPWPLRTLLSLPA